MPTSQEQELLTVLNDSCDPIQLMERFRDANGAPFDLPLAQSILDLRDTLPEESFQTLDQFQQIPGVSSSLTDRLLNNLWWNYYPVLMLPIRIETRFLGSDLWVRIYPDQILVDTHEPKLSQLELEARTQYLKQLGVISPDGPGAEEKKRDAWRGLVQLLGPERAAWIARTAEESMSELDLLTPEEERLTTPRLPALPDKFVAYAFRDGELLDSAEGDPVQCNLSLIAAAEGTEQELFDDNSRWVIDLEKAKRDGMAICFEGFTQTVSQLVVVGLMKTSAERGRVLLNNLVDSHHYSTGLGFLEYGTPTNNTQKASSGHSETAEDREGSYDIEVLDPSHVDDPVEVLRTNSRRLSQALGLGSESTSLRHLAGAGDRNDSYASDIRAALWPATGKHFLTDLLPGLLNDDELQSVEHHFVNHVRGSGPLPALRVGDQPYGILPATVVHAWSESNQRGWQASSRDNVEIENGEVFDDQLHSVLIGLQKKWLQWANDRQRVPRVGQPDDSGAQQDADPDQELLQILSMEPISTSYHVRPYADERFTGWSLVALAGEVFGPTTPYGSVELAPLHWISKWDQKWGDWRAEQADLWTQFTRLPKEKLETARLLHLLAWDNVHQLDGTMAELAGITGVGADKLPDQLSESDQERMYRETLDLCSHRLDAWITSLATKRLAAMREDKPDGILIGAYGWVENLSPNDNSQSEGYIHAPSPGQSAAAAVLHNAYLTHNGENGSNPFSINLDSKRVRQATRIIEGVRQGQLLGAMLGYLFERGLHEGQLDRHIDEFRAAFPIVANKATDPETVQAAEAIAARNVVDGLTLARWIEDRGRPDLFLGTDEAVGKIGPILSGNDSLQAGVDDLQAALDTVSDLFMVEGVYQSVQGNFERGGAALDAASGNAHPPELESIVTPVSGNMLGHRVCLIMPEPSTYKSGTSSTGTSPRSLAEPRIAAWIGDLFDDLSQIGCSYAYDTTADDGQLSKVAGGVTFADLQLSAVDLLYLSVTPPQGEETQIEQHIKYWVRQSHALEQDTPVDLNLLRPNNGQFIYGLGETLELGRQLLNLLGSGSQLRPDSLCHPALAGGAGYSEQDVLNLDARLDGMLAHVLQVINTLSGSDPGDSTSGQISIIGALFVAGQYGVYGAFPPGPVEPNLVLIPQTLLIPNHGKYRVKQGDTLWVLSQRTSTTIQRLVDINRIEDPSFLLVDQELFIPGFGTYRVKQSDSLWTIAQAFGTTVQALVKLNDIENPDLIVMGQELLVPAKTAELEIVEDTLLKDISQRFNVTIQSLVDVNHIYPQREAVLKELLKRVGDSRHLRAEANDTQSPIAPDQKISMLIDAMKSLFGRGFVVLPTFTPPSTDGTPLSSALTQVGLLGDQDETRVREWLQQFAFLRQPLNDLEHALMMTESWRQSTADRADQPAMTLHVAQLPYDEDDRWLGLDDDEKGKSLAPDDEDTNRGKLSIVAAIAGYHGDSQTADPRIHANQFAGLLLDQWDELIPEATVDTSVSFQFNAPNSQAPQALLLAVPSQRDATRKLWQVEDLAEIVKDTIDLAKIRAVDLDATREKEEEAGSEEGDSGNLGVGLIFPALMFLTGPQATKGLSALPDTIQEWAELLTDWQPISASGHIQLAGEDGFQQVVLRSMQQGTWTLESAFMDELVRLASIQVEVHGRADSESGILQVDRYEIVDVGGGQRALAGQLSESNGVFSLSGEDGAQWRLIIPETIQLAGLVGGKIWVAGSVSGQEIEVARYGILRLPAA